MSFRKPFGDPKEVKANVAKGAVAQRSTVVNRTRHQSLTRNIGHLPVVSAMSRTRQQSLMRNTGRLEEMESGARGGPVVTTTDGMKDQSVMRNIGLPSCSSRDPSTGFTVSDPIARTVDPPEQQIGVVLCGHTHQSVMRNIGLPPCLLRGAITGFTASDPIARTVDPPKQQAVMGHTGSHYGRKSYMSRGFTPLRSGGRTVDPPEQQAVSENFGVPRVEERVISYPVEPPMDPLEFQSGIRNTGGRFDWRSYMSEGFTPSGPVGRTEDPPEQQDQSEHQTTARKDCEGNWRLLDHELRGLFGTWKLASETLKESENHRIESLMKNRQKIITILKNYYNHAKDINFSLMSAIMDRILISRHNGMSLGKDAGTLVQESLPSTSLSTEDQSFLQQVNECSEDVKKRYIESQINMDDLKKRFNALSYNYNNLIKSWWNSTRNQEILYLKFTINVHCIEDIWRNSSLDNKKNSKKIESVQIEDSKDLSLQVFEFPLSRIEELVEKLKLDNDVFIKDLKESDSEITTLYNNMRIYLRFVNKSIKTMTCFIEQDLQFMLECLGHKTKVLSEPSNEGLELPLCRADHVIMEVEKLKLDNDLIVKNLKKTDRKITVLYSIFKMQTQYMEERIERTTCSIEQQLQLVLESLDHKTKVLSKPSNEGLQSEQNPVEEVISEEGLSASKDVVEVTDNEESLKDSSGSESGLDICCVNPFVVQVGNRLDDLMSALKQSEPGKDEQLSCGPEVMHGSLRESFGSEEIPHFDVRLTNRLNNLVRGLMHAEPGKDEETSYGPEVMISMEETIREEGSPVSKDLVKVTDNRGSLRKYSGYKTGTGKNHVEEIIPFLVRMGNRLDDLISVLREDKSGKDVQPSYGPEVMSEQDPMEGMIGEEGSPVSRDVVEVMDNEESLKDSSGSESGLDICCVNPFVVQVGNRLDDLMSELKQSEPGKDEQLSCGPEVMHGSLRESFGSEEIPHFDVRLTNRLNNLVRGLMHAEPGKDEETSYGPEVMSEQNLMEEVIVEEGSPVSKDVVEVLDNHGNLKDYSGTGSGRDIHHENETGAVDLMHEVEQVKNEPSHGPEDMGESLRESSGNGEIQPLHVLLGNRLHNLIRRLMQDKPRKDEQASYGPEVVHGNLKDYSGTGSGRDIHHENETGAVDLMHEVEQVKNEPSHGPEDMHENLTDSAANESRPDVHHLNASVVHKRNGLGDLMQDEQLSCGPNVRGENLRESSGNGEIQPLHVLLGNRLHNLIRRLTQGKPGKDERTSYGPEVMHENLKDYSGTGSGRDIHHENETGAVDLMHEVEQVKNEPSHGPEDMPENPKTSSCYESGTDIVRKKEMSVDYSIPEVEQEKSEPSHGPEVMSEQDPVEEVISEEGSPVSEDVVEVLDNEESLEDSFSSESGPDIRREKVTSVDYWIHQRIDCWLHVKLPVQESEPSSGPEVTEESLEDSFSSESGPDISEKRTRVDYLRHEANQEKSESSYGSDVMEESLEDFFSSESGPNIREKDTRVDYLRHEANQEKSESSYGSDVMEENLEDSFSSESGPDIREKETRADYLRHEAKQEKSAPSYGSDVMEESLEDFFSSESGPNIREKDTRVDYLRHEANQEKSESSYGSDVMEENLEDSFSSESGPDIREKETRADYLRHEAKQEKSAPSYGSDVMEESLKDSFSSESGPDIRGKDTRVDYWMHEAKQEKSEPSYWSDVMIKKGRDSSNYQSGFQHTKGKINLSEFPRERKQKLSKRGLEKKELVCSKSLELISQQWQEACKIHDLFPDFPMDVLLYALQIFKSREATVQYILNRKKNLLTPSEQELMEAVIVEEGSPVSKDVVEVLDNGESLEDSSTSKSERDILHDKEKRVYHWLHAMEEERSEPLHLPEVMGESLEDSSTSKSERDILHDKEKRVYHWLHAMEQERSESLHRPEVMGESLKDSSCCESERDILHDRENRVYHLLHATEQERSEPSHGPEVMGESLKDSSSSQSVRDIHHENEGRVDFWMHAAEQERSEPSYGPEVMGESMNDSSTSKSEQDIHHEKERRVYCWMHAEKQERNEPLYGSVVMGESLKESSGSKSVPRIHHVNPVADPWENRVDDLIREMMLDESRKDEQTSYGPEIMHENLKTSTCDKLETDIHHEKETRVDYQMHEAEQEKSEPSYVPEIMHQSLKESSANESGPNIHRVNPFVVHWENRLDDLIRGLLKDEPGDEEQASYGLDVRHESLKKVSSAYDPVKGRSLPSYGLLTKRADDLLHNVEQVKSEPSYGPGVMPENLKTSSYYKSGTDIVHEKETRVDYSMPEVEEEKSEPSHGPEVMIKKGRDSSNYQSGFQHTKGKINLSEFPRERKQKLSKRGLEKKELVCSKSLELISQQWREACQIRVIFPHFPMDVLLYALQIFKSTEMTINYILNQKILLPPSETDRCSGQNILVLNKIPGNTSLLWQQACQIRNIFPQVLLSAILYDLQRTESMEVTLENVANGNLVPPPVSEEYVTLMDDIYNFGVRVRICGLHMKMLQQSSRPASPTHDTKDHVP